MDIAATKLNLDSRITPAPIATSGTALAAANYDSLIAVDSSVAQWYAAYTSANHEKSVASQLVCREVEHFLPLYDSVRKWKDRRVNLQLPLFSGYVFVRIALQNRLKVLQVPGVAYLVNFGGRAVPLPQEDLQRIRKLLDAGVAAKPHPYLAAGRCVRVKGGPLKGFEGIIVKRKNATRFVLSIRMLQRSLVIDIDGMELESLPHQFGPAGSVVSNG